MTSPEKRFGDIVAKRRSALGLNRKQVQQNGGPSDTKLAAIESGDSDARMHSSTLEKLDTALQWVPGSASRALSGGEPTPLSSQGEALRFGPNEVAVPIVDLTSLIRATDTLNMALLDLDSPSDDVKSSFAELSAVVSRLTLIKVIDLFERNAGPDHPPPPNLDLIFGTHLNQPAERQGADPTDLEDRLYLRWLAHRRVNIDAATEHRFRQRWFDHQPLQPSNISQPFTSESGGE
ncbi:MULTISPECIES: hypothetical protein [Rhodococcus]|uniref:Helix-turn-helix domain-containing protein n=1 Tax=Rhodococcus baikonurensis TaxID=172041 RepID=A0ABV5XMP8_9NOCA|nr:MULTISPECIES: hypothetical protein [Rhodococcus]AZI65522.1 hypothetical protein EHW12_30860 [Rhodococcus sp. NJ-530]KSU67449.1 hypothetical protein AS032_31615 [Rhodococcus qingshengii]KZF17918.1 hypothetical protein A2J01_22895 [Rhodococcus sp. EPR-134]MDJ0440361.1 hypothetical protein [Rhodococcus qingshengii]SCC69432.1 hypothetical protein GA0061093_12825 [Rhodococcus qingshengii]